jgi:cobalt-zinc-cadmium efflux system membrane fusion protein
MSGYIHHPLHIVLDYRPLVLLSVALALCGCHRPEKPAEAAEPKVSGDTVAIPTNSPQLSALTVESVEGQPRAFVPLAGRLVWDEDATVRVFTPFAGIVRKLFVEVNQPVTNGMALAEIQSPDFGQAQAEARKAESEFRRAERAYNRVRDLFEHGAAPHKDMESAEADYASAQAERDRAHARLAIYGATATSENQDFLLPSPLNGVVVERNVTPGQEVRPDQMLANMPQFTAPLFVITDPSRLWIQIDATEADLPHLRPGREFAFITRAFPGQTFMGRVDTVSEFIDPATRTIKVRGSFDNSRRLLKAEMFISVNLPDGEAPGASVPSKAVFLKGEKHYVFVEEQAGQFARHEVSVGAEQNGRMLVLAGLQPGQRVVTDGCLLLQQALK